MATFGYPPGNTPASEAGQGGDIRACKFTAPAGGGTITQISTYTRNTGGGSNTIRTAIYSDVAGNATTLLASATAATTVTGSSFAWYDSPISYVFAAGEVLWLCQWPSDANGSENYDAGAANQESYGPGIGSYPTWPSPTITFGGQQARLIAIYATYTGAAPPPDTFVTIEFRG